MHRFVLSVHNKFASKLFFYKQAAAHSCTATCSNNNTHFDVADEKWQNDLMKAQDDDLLQSIFLMLLAALLFHGVNLRLQSTCCVTWLKPAICLRHVYVMMTLQTRFGSQLTGNILSGLPPPPFKSKNQMKMIRLRCVVIGSQHLT